MKLLQLNASDGALKVVNTVQTSAGVADADKTPSLNAGGKIDATMLNSTVASAGAGDAGKLLALDGAGRINGSAMPVGIGADTQIIQASENLAAGDFVNIWDNAGAFRVRKADASSAGKYANGVVLAAVLSGANATVYFEGTNTAVTGVTPGARYLSSTVAGGHTDTPPSAPGTVLQVIGYGTSATTINVNCQTPFINA